MIFPPSEMKEAIALDEATPIASSACLSRGGKIPYALIPAKEETPMTPDDLSIDYEEGGILTTKQLDKVILSKGAWTTILFRYQNWDQASESYGEDKFTIRRYQKRNGEYTPRSKFNITNAKQAGMIIEALQGWIK